MSLNIALYNAVSGLQLNQRALDVIAQNVANVNTEGYSRKVVHQESVILNGIGSGVRIADIARNVNEFMLKDTRAASSQLGISVVQDTHRIEKNVVIDEVEAAGFDQSPPNEWTEGA